MSVSNGLCMLGPKPPQKANAVREAALNAQLMQRESADVALPRKQGEIFQTAGIRTCT